MDKQIYAQLLDLYRSRRENNWRIEQKRKEEVFSLHPDIETLANNRHNLILTGIRSAFKKVPGEDPETVMKRYNEKIGDLLEKYGYARDYLSPVYQCPLCRDTGMIGDNIKSECPCFHKAYVAALSRREGCDINDKTFENFDITRFPDLPMEEHGVSQRAYMKVIRRKCEEFADAYPAGPVKNILMHGGSGLGKTYLMFCIADRLENRGQEVLYISAYQLLEQMKNAYFNPSSGDASVYENTCLLLIDDLGMEPLFENITVELFFNLLNQRTMKNLGTVISTNLSRTELQRRYTERFTSRLLDARTCLDLPFYGKDIRLLNQ